MVSRAFLDAAAEEEEEEEENRLQNVRHAGNSRTLVDRFPNTDGADGRGDERICPNGETDPR